MFIFFGDLKPKEWFNSANFTLDVNNFSIRIQENRISCIIDYGYVTDFNTEIKEPAMLAMRCVQIAQAACTNKKLSLDYLSWVELKMKLTDVIEKFILGHFLISSEFEIDNKKFLADFSSGLKYANQAFNGINMRVALEDYERTLDSEWDENIYHCQHCLEAIRDYFGLEDVGWKKMRKELDIEEKVLREVTDFSSKYIRHGSERVKINMNKEDKSFQAGKCQGICCATLDKFGKYLHDQGIKFSVVKSVE
jgi:hypothetical protein